MNGKNKFIAKNFDPDAAPDLSKNGWPDKFAKVEVRRGRPLSENRKVLTTIRFSREVIDHFRADGRGWQTRIYQALREWIKRKDTA